MLIHGTATRRLALILCAMGLSTPAFAQTPKAGGSFISAQTTEATGLDPQLVPALSRSRRSPMMYSQLVRFDADMNVVPELAESWQISPDGLTWTFKLRQGVKFHDGQELTSADVKASYERILNPETGSGLYVYLAPRDAKAQRAWPVGSAWCTKGPHFA